MVVRRMIVPVRMVVAVIVRMIMAMVVRMMRVVMVVIVIVTMPMVMMGMVIVVVVMRVGASVRGTALMMTTVMPVHAAVAIGAALGIERRLDRRDHGAEAFEHRLDDMIAADAQPVAEQFRRQMAVAEMPGDADQMRGIARRHLGEVFRRRHDGDDAAVLEHQPIAMAQRHGARQVEQERSAAGRRHRDAPPVPRIEIEQHGIRRRLRPQAGWINGNGADHLTPLKGRQAATAGPA